MRLRDAHFYRKLPRDVTEGTGLGGAVSIGAVVTILFLVISQYAEFKQPRRATRLKLNTARAIPVVSGGDMDIRINFNITMKHLPCEYTSLHATDHVGSHYGGEQNVHKVRLTRAGGSLGMYEPHSYQKDEERKARHGMADHVFPWHKKERAQGEAKRGAETATTMAANGTPSSPKAAAEAEKRGARAPGAKLPVAVHTPYVPTEPLVLAPVEPSEAEFVTLLRANAIVMVNFFAPWCHWSNKLAPAWDAVATRLHDRAYAQSVKFIRIDCTSPMGKAICLAQSVHAFPSVRTYRGSAHAFEPYEFGREENLMWLHLVKNSAEVLVEEMREAEEAEKALLAQQIDDVSADLKAVMQRRAAGDDEDWSEDAMSQDDEIAEERDLLGRISDAVSSITGAKGAHADDTQEQQRTADHVVNLLSETGRKDLTEEEGGEPWPEIETHEGCNLFGYVDVARAPGTLHISPHSTRHSFDFGTVNTTHHIDHLSFGLELGVKQRARLPPEVSAQLMPLDDTHYISDLPHETREHHINIMPTSVRSWGTPIETYQFTVQSYGRTRETLPSLVISYDIVPLNVQLVDTSTPTAEFIISLCAIVGGAFAIFGMLDAILFAGSNGIKRILR